MAKGDGAVDYISGMNEHWGRFYVLRKHKPTGDELIVVQMEPVVPASNMPIEVAMRSFPAWDREFDYGLEIIQTLLPTIEFGRTNWAHLFRRRDGSYTIKQENQLFHEIPWCSLVEERDIEFTNWLYAEERHGIWNGKEVDIFMAWDTSYAPYLDKTMAAYKLLSGRGLDHLAYPAVGHVVRNGTADICGIMTQPAYGRMVEYTDKSLVYKAISQIERGGLLFTGIKLSNIMVTDDGQVRLLSLCALMNQPSNPKERDKELAYWHWEQLESIFKELEHHANPFPPMRSLKPTHLEIPELPSPGRAPRIEIYVLWVSHACKCQADDFLPAGADKSKVVEPYSVRPPANTSHIEMVVFEQPLSANSLRAPRVRVLARATIPYRKPEKRGLEKSQKAFFDQMPLTARIEEVEYP